MARYTSSYYKEHLGRGATPRWFTHRYKSKLNDAEVPVGNLGTANDLGYDPAIASIPVSTTGTENVCEFPTNRAWSSGCETMYFLVSIENNTAGTLTVDLEFYEGKYGSTGAIEYWRPITTSSGKGDGDVIKVNTDGGRIFTRVAAITNEDNDAQLYLECRKAHHSAPAVSGGASHE